MNNMVLIIGGVVVGILVIVLSFATLANRKKEAGPRQQQPSGKKPKESKKGHQESADIILDAIEDGVVLVNSSGMIQTFNPGASRITGWPAEEAIGLDYHSVFKFVDSKNKEYGEPQNPLTRVFTERAVVRDHQITLISRSNKYIALHMIVSPLLDDEQQVSGAVGVFRDVSEERSEERQRAEFISTASHEMRTPVAAIEGYLALAMNDRVSKIDSKARDYLTKARASTQHLGKLFQDLLTSARAEDGRLSSHPSVVDLGEFLEKLTEDLRFAAQKKGLGMEFIIGNQGQIIDASSSNKQMVRPFYYVNVDPDRLREVITNLIDNAIKYTDTGKISIGLTGDNNIAQFYIKDTGAGIPPEDISHLFQKFYRVDNSATRTIGGTGLGLFISRKIVELYSGRIWVESSVGKGSTFYVNLPRLDNAKAEQLKQQNTTSNNNKLPDITSLANP